MKGIIWVAVEALGWTLLVLAAVAALPFVALVWVVAAVNEAWRRVRRAARPPNEPPDVDGPTGFWQPHEARERAPEGLVGKDADGRIDAVFEGGGVKAIAQIGAVAAAEALHLDWRLLAGTSGGAIVAALLAHGRTSRDIWRLLAEDDLSRILDSWYLPRERGVRRRKYFLAPLLPGLAMWKGAVSGRTFLAVMRKELQLKDGRPLTFGDLRTLPSDSTDPTHVYCLRVVATDVSRGRPIVLPDDLPQYWEPWERARREIEREGGDASALTAEQVRDRFPVAEAVRMSMSIPFVFAPYRLHLNGEGREDEASAQCGRGGEVEIVDGGVSSNFPIWIFDRSDSKPPTRPTFGFLLDETRSPHGRDASEVPRVWTALALFRHVVTSGMGAMDKRLSEHNKSRTARLSTLGVSTTDFGLPPARQRELYVQGYRDAMDFFRQFDWDKYRERFRGVRIEPAAGVDADAAATVAPSPG